MCQNSNYISLGIGNDYSLLSANTGIATISLSDPDLKGSGAVTVLTAGGSNGTIVKSVIIKAIQPVSTGMVRFFISNGTAISLYKEIPISTSPAMETTPIPAPILKTFEMKLIGDLKLASGNTLLASTQNAETFNIIAEGLDIKYPETTPSECCNFMKEAAVNGLGTIDIANGNLNGLGTIVPIFTAPNTNGSLIKSITIKGQQTTNNGMVRIFISPNGTDFSLLQEIYITQIPQSGFQPSFKHVIELNLAIEAGYTIGASTQLAQGFALIVEAVAWSYGIS